MTKEITPGTIVCARDIGCENYSRLAIVTPRRFFEVITEENINKVLARCEASHPQTKFLTLFEMTPDFEMKRRVIEVPRVVPYFSIFDSKDNLDKNIAGFRCFTHPAESRHKRKFFAEIMFIKEFLDGKRILREYPSLGFRKGLVEALNAWRRDHDKEEVSSSST
jgi:hypothetical protein